MAGRVIFGCDIAREGTDRTVVAIRKGNIVTELVCWGKQDTMETVGRIVGLANRHKPNMIVVDVIGIGAGVYDRLREQGFPVEAFNASERSDITDRSGELGFINRRSAGWWNLREVLDPANKDSPLLPADNELIGDLTVAHWRVQSGGKLQVESKDDIKKRLGRSTDKGDAVMMAFAMPEYALPFGWVALEE